jgi:hypothetical protein
MPPTLDQCTCGCSQSVRTCMELRQGTRTLPAFQWVIPSGGLTLADQQRIASAVASFDMGYTVTPGADAMILKQAEPLGPEAVVSLDPLYPLVRGDLELAKHAPKEAFWDPHPLADRPTPNVAELTKTQLLAMIEGFSRALRPVRSIEKRLDNIAMVVGRFHQQLPDGQVDLVGKSWASFRRLALFRVLAHLALFDANTVAKNLEDPTGTQSPFLSTMAQSSALPLETLLHHYRKHGFVIDWVDQSLVFWLGPSETVPEQWAPSAILSPWAGPTAASFDLDLSLPLYRQLLTWAVGAINDMFRFLITGSRYQSCNDPAQAWMGDWLVWTEINNLTHAIMRAEDAFVRLELFLRLAYNIVSRMGRPGKRVHIADLPFGPRDSRLKSLLFQTNVPQDLRHHLWQKWQELTTRVGAEIMSEILPAFRPSNPTDSISVKGKRLTAEKYVAQLVEALRHSTHGFAPGRTDKTILFTQTGRFSDSLPYIAFFWWIALLARPEWVFT